MAGAYTQAGRTNLLATSADEPFLILLEITHPDLAEPVRVVNDTVDASIVQDDGSGTAVDIAFVACPFQITLPDDVDQQIPKAQLSVDNIGRELTQWLEYSNGGRGAKCRILQALKSEAEKYQAWEFGDYAAGYFAEDYVEGESLVDWRPFEYDMTLDMTSMAIDNLAVTADLGYQRTAGMPAVAMRYDPKTAPGLF